MQLDSSRVEGIAEERTILVEELEEVVVVVVMVVDMDMVDMKAGKNEEKKSNTVAVVVDDMLEENENFLQGKVHQSQHK